MRKLFLWRKKASSKKAEAKAKNLFAIKIPDQRKYARGEGAWNVKKRYHPKQAVVPSDPKLIEKIGVSAGDKINFFAGSTGDWAADLAKETEVYYSDASKSFTKKAREEKAGSKIKLFRTREGSITIQRPLVYDWSISFDPLDMLGGALELSLAKSLLNNKGAKIINWAVSYKHFYDKEVKRIGEIYGAEAFYKDVNVYDERVKGYSKVRVSTILSNPQARRKAQIDFAVMKVLREKKKEGRTESPSFTLKQLKEKLLSFRITVSEKELEESLGRINKLSELIDHTIHAEIKK